ncbi:MAG TPA: FeoA family protein [Thermoanaerobaculia bacterium]|nr:FeoA family protein [Thermoanaerobaculia bacterium]
MSHECPLCSTDFTGEECHSSCPMARGCTMVRCPRCGYEFVESGRFADMLRRWIRRAPVRPAGDVVPVLDLPVGATASIASVDCASAARLSRLASYGIAAGSEVRLLARRPAVVLACGPATVAVEDEVAREIHVRTGSARVPR